jgi:serine/threonine protein kinase
MLHCPTCGRHYSSDWRECPEDGTPLHAEATVEFQVQSDPLIGKVFDAKYRLEELIGEGGMGSVYKATHLLIDRPVSVKVMHPRLVEDEAARIRFQREAKAAGRLQHVNAVTVTDFGSTDDGYVYLVMELLEGRSLKELLAREAPLEPARAVSFMLQVSAAVAVAHEAGIIHRDLKPANIFIQQRKHAPPVVKVLDFGIAKVVAESLDEAEQQALTLTGVMIGTPRYMSPEQCESRVLTPASDVYSMGIILYEMLTSTTPFSGSSPLALAMKHSREEPRPPSEFVSSIAPEIEAVVLHALEKDPDQRPKDGGAFRQELYAVAQQLGLDHFTGGAMPSMETLRNAGIESPSGRLVIDMGRLRNSPTGTTEISKAVETNGQGGATSVVPADFPEVNPTPVELMPQAAGGAPFSRVHVALTRRRPWYQSRPAYILSMVAAGVIIITGIWAVFSRSQKASPAGALITASPSPATEPQVGLVPEPSPSEQPTPTPSPPEYDEGNSKTARPRQAEEKRRSQAPERRPTPKKDSTVKSILKKAGRILRGPF